jgi:RNA polymerase sigma-70 factor (ECF subfamily)
VEELEEAENEVWEEEGPLERIVERERAAIVQHCMSLLRPAYREMLILREYEHLSYVKIARITGTSESAVKSALFKARKAMGKKLDSIMNERNEL